MPLPMVHLIVAQKLLEISVNIKEPAQFYLGSISPDAIHMRANTNRADKNATHFRGEDKTLQEQTTMQFIVDIQGKDDADFLLGYAVHVLTDIQWALTVYNQFNDKYAQDDAPVQEGPQAYYNDADLIDLELYKMSTNPEQRRWRESVWEMLQQCTAPAAPGLLTAEEVEKWKVRTLGWYDANANNPYYPMRYMTLEGIEAFTQYAAQKIDEILSGESFSLVIASSTV